MSGTLTQSSCLPYSPVTPLYILPSSPHTNLYGTMVWLKFCYCYHYYYYYYYYYCYYYYYHYYYYYYYYHFHYYYYYYYYKLLSLVFVKLSKKPLVEHFTDVPDRHW